MNRIYRRQYVERTFKNGNLYVVIDQNDLVIKSNSCNFVCGQRTTLAALITFNFFIAQ